MLSIPTEIKRLASELAFAMSRGGDLELVDPMLAATRAFLDVPVADVLSSDDDDPIRKARRSMANERFDALARVLDPISRRYEIAEIILALATEYLTRGDRGVAIGKIRDQVVFDVQVVTVLATTSTLEGLCLLIEWQAIGRGGKPVKSGRTKIPNDEMVTPQSALFLDACRNEIILREFHGIGQEPDVSGDDVNIRDQAVDVFSRTRGQGYEAKA